MYSDTSDNVGMHWKWKLKKKKVVKTYSKVHFSKSFIVWLPCQLSKRFTRCFLYWDTFYFWMKFSLYFRFFFFFISAIIISTLYLQGTLDDKKATYQFVSWIFLFYIYADKGLLLLFFLVQFLHFDKNTEFQVTF